MKVPVPTNEEIAFRQCLTMLRINPLVMSTYYSTLFLTFKSLLVFEDIQRLNHMVKDIEKWLCDDFNKITLKEIELRMYNNMDLNSYFLVNGEEIRQLHINSRLEDIKQWLTQKLYLYLRFIRFTAPIEVQ